MRRLITGAAVGAAAVLTMATQVMAQSFDRFENFDPEYYDYDALYNATAGSAAAASSFAGLSLVWVCCIFIFALALPTALAIFVYKDAQKNKVDNPIIWALLTFFFNVIGLLIYFLAIRQDAIRAQEHKGGSEHKEKKEEHHHEEMKDSEE